MSIDTADVIAGIAKAVGAYVITKFFGDKLPVIGAICASCILAAPLAAPTKNGVQAFRQFLASAIATYWLSLGAAVVAVEMHAAYEPKFIDVQAFFAIFIGLALHIVISKLPEIIPKLLDAVASKITSR